MYLFEYGFWQERSKDPEVRAKEEAELDAHYGKGYFEPSGPVEDDGTEWGPADKASDIPTDGDAFYEVNDTFIEARAAWQEEKRGLITFLTLGLGFGLGVNLFGWVYWQLIHLAVFGTTIGGDAATTGAWLSLSFVGLLGLVMGYFVWKYLLKFVRLELFTQRHLLIRFNRKTRQVHLHRPDYAGGVVTYPWESTRAGIAPESPDSEGLGQCLVLVWPSEYNGAGYDEMAFVGPPLDGNREIEGLWEYIRRYIEDGPQAVPKPKSLRARFPWPWDSVKASLRFMRPMWRRGGGVWVVLTLVLLSPLIALHSVSHWVSMLLCWRPRWPRDIREAGQPGKPVPELTVAEDFGPEIGRYLRENAKHDKAKMNRRIAKRASRRKKEVALHAPTTVE